MKNSGNIFKQDNSKKIEVKIELALSVILEN